jgi:hypothetical protein
MTTAQLHRAVSRVTGEPIEVIARHGFSLVDEEAPLDQDDWEALALDWDQLDAERRGEAPRAAA